MIKKSLKIFILCFGFFAVFSLYFNLFLSVNNYNHNKKQSIAQAALKNDLINYQKNMENYKFGTFRLSYNGCGVIATYNILKLLGKEENLEDIIREYDIYGSNFFGLFGTNPLGVKRFFNRRGADVKFIFDKNKFENEAKKSKLSMFVYASLSGGHYLLIEYDEEADTFLAINPWLETTGEEMINLTNGNIITFLIAFNF